MAKGKYKEWLTKDKLLLLECWARDGLTDSQIANNIGINPSTLYDWKNKYPEFSDTLKKGKEVVDYEVENALLKRALGYTYKDQIAIKKKNADGSESVEVREINKTVIPDTTAQIFWLKNRKPIQWRDKQEIENINKNIEINIGDWEEYD